MLLQYLRDGRRQRGLAMIDVTNRPHVAVRLVAIKFLFRHIRPQLSTITSKLCHPERRSLPRRTYAVLSPT
jgi:hypothetical protein